MAKNKNRRLDFYSPVIEFFEAEHTLYDEEIADADDEESCGVREARLEVLLKIDQSIKRLAELRRLISVAHPDELDNLNNEIE